MKLKEVIYATHDYPRKEKKQMEKSGEFENKYAEVKIDNLNADIEQILNQ